MAYKIIENRSWREIFAKLKKLAKTETEIECCDDPISLKLGWKLPKSKTVLRIKISALNRYLEKLPKKQCAKLRNALSTDLGREAMAAAMLGAARKAK